MLLHTKGDSGMRPISTTSNETFFDLHKALNDRASFYTTSGQLREKIVQRCLLLALDDPSLMLKDDIEQAMFQILHDVACEEYQLAKSSRKFFKPDYPTSPHGVD